MNYSLLIYVLMIALLFTGVNHLLSLFKIAMVDFPGLTGLIVSQKFLSRYCVHLVSVKH